MLAALFERLHKAEHSMADTHRRGNEATNGRRFACFGDGISMLSERVLVFTLEQTMLVVLHKSILNTQ